MKTAPLNLNVRMLKAQLIETLLYRCVTRTLRAEHFARIRSVHHQVLLRVISFRRRQRADYAAFECAKSLT